METTVLRESQVFIYPEGHWPSKADWLSELFLNIKRVPESLSQRRYVQILGISQWKHTLLFHRL